ncbi:MAG: NnrS family protein [Stellaceae bacterium]
MNLTMNAIPRYRPHAGPVILSAGFRPFFLASALWAAIAIPLWLAAYAAGLAMPSALPALVWHVHEMVFGFAAATVAGFMLTAIPNWTGRMPLQGAALATLVGLWALGRVGVLFSSVWGEPAAAVADLSFPAVFLGAIAREIIAGRNRRNLPMLAALALLLIGNLLVHLDALGLAATAELGNRIGLATLWMLISLVGGRIIPSFTRNWLVKARPGTRLPAPAGRFDQVTLVVTGIALALWAGAPEARATSWALLVAGVFVAVRLCRWRGLGTTREPLLLILHVGYGWLALGLVLLGVNGLDPVLPATAALHALTVGAIGTMTLAVMTRASLGHTGRPLSAGPGTGAIYLLVTLAAVLRILAPLAGAHMVLALWLAGAAWSGAFGLFAVLYGQALARPRVRGEGARAI